jgi:hypothetical protein
MIGFIGTSLQLQSIMTAHNQWLPKTRFIPYWTARTSVFLWLWWMTNEESLLTHWTPLRMLGMSESESYVTTDGQSASLSWYKAPLWSPRSDFYYCQTVPDLLMSGALSDERTGVSFTMAAGPCQRSHSRVRVPWVSGPYLECQIIEFSWLN